jgi:hypothetical protein
MLGQNWSAQSNSSSNKKTAHMARFFVLLGLLADNNHVGWQFAHGAGRKPNGFLDAVNQNGFLLKVRVFTNFRDASGFLTNAAFGFGFTAPLHGVDHNARDAPYNTSLRHDELLKIKPLKIKRVKIKRELILPS